MTEPVMQFLELLLQIKNNNTIFVWTNLNYYILFEFELELNILICLGQKLYKL